MTGGPDLSWLQVPDGFCVHFFATVPETRNLKFAPNGDLFVASPSFPCAGGASGGMGSIVVVPDDNHDGVGDSLVTYKGGIPQVQGLLFSGGYWLISARKWFKGPVSQGDEAQLKSIEAEFSNIERELDDVN